MRSANAGSRLSEWLNSRSAIGHDVAKVISEMQAAIHFAQLSRADVWRDEDEEIQELEKRVARIRRVTKQYPVFLDPIGMDIHPDNFYLGFRPVSGDRRTRHGCLALADWKLLADAGAQWKLRRCLHPGCQLYFYAKRKDQVFHVESCEEKHKRASAKFKEKRRKRDANAYRDDLPPLKQKKLDQKRAKRALKAKNEAKQNWHQLLHS
jgi:predicted RNA-binding Zn ribbon-like protein